MEWEIEKAVINNNQLESMDRKCLENSSYNDLYKLNILPLLGKINVIKSCC